MHVLLVEPNFKYVKYPPLGLLKLATYYRNRGYSCALVKKKESYSGPVPDIICITSLFTYAWEPVIKAYTKYRNKYPNANIRIGGIYASLMPDHVKYYCPEAEIFQGVSDELDQLVPAWDLVPNWKSSILFTTRGCPNSCEFCAVKNIEPAYSCKKIDISQFIYPTHKNLIIQDNNILANKKHWQNIFTQLIQLKFKVDFNQGLDASYIDVNTASQLKELKIDFIRLAYDQKDDRDSLQRAIANLKDAGIKHKNIMVYTLFNFNDSPENFLDRFKDLLEWNVVCYPMKYEPINTLEKNIYTSSDWSENDLELLADARRVLGWGGSFIPHQGLKEKIFSAKSFEEAFSLRPIQKKVTK